MLPTIYSKILLIFLLGFALPEVVMAHSVAITNVTIIDGTGAAPQTKMTVLVQGGKITVIRKTTGTTIPAGATVINGKGKYLLPGFIDSNVHSSI